MKSRIIREGARYMDYKEIEDVTVDVSLQKKCKRISGPVVGITGRNKQGRVTDIKQISDEQSHICIIGGTGSGKSRRELLPYILNIINARESIIINDCKEEILPMVYPLLKKHQYKTIIMNFKDPSRSIDKYNPLQLAYYYYHNGELSKAFKIVNRLAENLMLSVESEEDKYWVQSGTAVFTACCSLLMRFGKKETCNLKSVVLIIEQLMEGLTVTYPCKKNDRLSDFFGEKYIENLRVHQILFAENEELRNSNEYTLLQVLITNAKDTQQCILSVLRSALSDFYSYDDICDFTSDTTFDMTEIGTQKTAVFIISSDYTSDMDSIVSTFLDDLYSVLVYHADNFARERKLPIRVNYLLDEFNNMPCLHDIEKKISLSRSRGIRFILVIQSYAALCIRYKKQIADSIIANCKICIYLGSAEYELQRVLQEKLGRVVLPSGVEVPLVSVNDLNMLRLGQVLCIYNGRCFYSELMDISDYYFPRDCKPMQQFVFEKRKEDNGIQTWSLKQYCLELLSKKYDVSIDYLLGKENT